jgi:DNA-binding NtrC family response regulator
MSGDTQILVVDDEEPLCRWLAAGLQEMGYATLVAGTLSEARQLLAARPVSLALLDLTLPDGSGLELLPNVKSTMPDMPVIVLTASSDVATAVEAMKRGADDYLTKPAEMEKVKLAVKRSLELAELRMEVTRLRRERRQHLTPWFVGSTTAMAKLAEQVYMVAPSPAPVLIQGETGTGKDVLAGVIVELSARAEAPLLRLNCAAIPLHLMESELFGHERGAFTGAATQRKGFLELASGGTLFMDEISSMSLDLQSRLLTAIESWRFFRVGGSKEISVDVRLISASNRDLLQMMREGTFREDLYYRLNVVCLQLPPLRQRKEDIPELASLLLSEVNRKDRPVGGFSRQAMRALEAHDWPGNIRELRNCVARAVVHCQGVQIEVRDLPPHIADRAPSNGHLHVAALPAHNGHTEAFSAPAPNGHSVDTSLDDRVVHLPDSGLVLTDVLAQCERDLVSQALHRADGDLAAAARLLGCGQADVTELALRHGLAVDAVGQPAS